jgi:FkbM family methyltransferase
MTAGNFRNWSKFWLPRPLWVLLRRGWAYLQRLGWWVRVLAEVRGDGAGEALKLYASALASPITALRRLDQWGNPLLLFETRVRLAGGDRYHIRRFSDDLWHVMPSGQGAVRAALARHLRPGGVFVDAGANIGGFTVPGARLAGSGGTVVAVEMMPETARRLREHLKMNGLDTVRVVERALSDNAGYEVVAKMPAGLSGQASIVWPGHPQSRFVEARVQTTTLDDVVEGLPNVDLLKVDLEGAEAMAFGGGAAALSRTQVVIFEARDGTDEAREAMGLIVAAGFELHRLDGSNMIGTRPTGRNVQDAADPPGQS